MLCNFSSGFIVNSNTMFELYMIELLIQWAYWRIKFPDYDVLEKNVFFLGKLSEIGFIFFISLFWISCHSRTWRMSLNIVEVNCFWQFLITLVPIPCLKPCHFLFVIKCRYSCFSLQKSGRLFEVEAKVRQKHFFCHNFTFFMKCLQM